MKLRLKLGIVLVCLTFWTGCSILPELVAPAANFAIGFYDHDDYYSKECLWYDEVKLNEKVLYVVIKYRVIIETEMVTKRSDIDSLRGNVV